MGILKFAKAYFIFIVMLSANLFAQQDILKDIGVSNKNIKQGELLKAKFKNIDSKELLINDSNGTLWVKLTLYNRFNKKVEKEIVITTPLFEKIDVYRKYKKSIKKIITLNYKDKDYSSQLAHLNIKIEPDSTSIYYIHFASTIKGQRFNINIESKEQFLSKERFKIYRDNIIVGIIMSAVLLILFLYYILKDKNYLYLAMSLVAGFYYILFYSGNLGFIVPDGLIKLNFNIYSILIDILFIIYTIHTIKFFNLDVNKNIFNLFKVFIYLVILEIIVASFFELPTWLTLVTSILFLLVNLYIAIAGLKNGIKGARFNIISTLILALFIIISNFFYVNNSMLVYLISSFFMILSYLDRAHIEKKKEINKIVNELDKKFIIEQKVKEKQSQLEELEKGIAVIKDDINDSVKNHLQTVLTMLKIQQNREDYGDVSTNLNRLELRLSSLVKVYNIILSSKDYKNINMKSIIESIVVDQLDRYKNMDKSLDIITDIDAKLKLYDALYIASSVVDTISNSYRNSDNEKIKITIKEKDDGYDFSLKYKDNLKKNSIFKKLFFN